MDHRVDKELTGWSHSELWSTARCPGGDQWQVLLLKDWYFDQHCLTSLSVTWAVRSRAPLANLQTTPSSVVQLTHWREGMSSTGTLTGLRGGPVQTSWSATRPSARPCTQVRIILSTNAGWAENRLRAALPKKTWGCGLTRSSTWPSTCSPESKLCSGQHQRSVASRLREVILLLYSGETPPGVLRPALEPSAQERHGPVGAGPEEATKMNRGMEHLSYEEGLRDLGLFSLHKRRLWGDLVAAFPVPEQGLQESRRGTFYKGL